MQSSTACLLEICLRERSWRRADQLRIWKEDREHGTRTIRLQRVRFRPNCRLLPVRHRLLWRFSPGDLPVFLGQRRQKSLWKSSQDKKRADLCVSRLEMGAKGLLWRRKTGFWPLTKRFLEALPTDAAINLTPASSSAVRDGHSLDRAAHR
jgi:hypothetical protein